MDEPVVTAAQLDAMSPQERQMHFEASVVDRGTLTPLQLAAVHARQEQVIAQHEYDSTPELRDLLSRAMQSPRVRRSRR